MPETRTETTAEPAAPAKESAGAAQPEHKPMKPSGGDHGGVYSVFRQVAAESGGQEPPPDRFSSIFGQSDFAHPANDAARARALGDLQQNYGNRYVQRVLAPHTENGRPSAPSPIQRQAAGAASNADAAVPEIGHSINNGGGHALDPATQGVMESRFGRDFSGVRVHTDAAATRAADSLNATAFTAGRDVYFNRGAYDPSSSGGQRLLAHELAHVAQQDQGLAGTGPHGFRVSQPDDPLERQAEAASDAVMRGEMFPALSSSSAPMIHRQAAARPASAGGGGNAAATTAARAGDFLIKLAGSTASLPLVDVLRGIAETNRVDVPQRYLRGLQFPAFKVTRASIDLDDSKLPAGASIDAEMKVPPLEGRGTLNVDKQGNASGSVHVVFSSQKIPGIKQTEIDAQIKKDDLTIETSLDFELPKVTGNLKYKYENGKHSGKGKANYEGAKLKGSLEIILSEAAKISGSGMLEMELFKGLKGEAEVAVDEKRNIAVKGKLSFPGQIELFPEKKYEKSFFNFEKKFPIWGITIPVIDVNVGIFAEIHAGAGFRSKFGPGVLRDIALTGEFGTDPEAATEFGLGGEFYVPAAAEIVINVGGGIGLGLAIADITGGIEAVGVAGLYTALTVRPQFKYSGGKYSIGGMAELAGVAQAKFGINAFAKIDVGVWLFKGTVWRKDWTLAEWVWNSGLNVALRANINYTLGDDFAPEINFETGQVDPEKFIKDAMPESGSPVPAPPKPPVPEKSAFTAEGAQGTQAAGAPGQAPSPPTPGAPPARTQAGGASTGGATPPTPGAAEASGPGVGQGEPQIVAHQRTPDGRHEIKITESGDVMRYSTPSQLRGLHGALVTPHPELDRWLRRIEHNAKTRSPEVQAQAAQDASVFDQVMRMLSAALATGQLVIDVGRTLSEAEAKLASRLLSEGRRLRAVAEGSGRTGDFEVDGEKTEGKEISGITSADPAGALARRILAGAGQAPNIIIDARPQPNITQEIAENAIRRAYGKQQSDFQAGVIPTLRIQSIRVIGHNFDITVPRTP